MMHNNLFLNRLIIFTHEGKKAYDENFHKGVNIITGDNSSGKSTISHFIFYILGGSFTKWTKEALKCSTVYAEVEMNGATLTLKREVGTSSKMPMYIYWGEYLKAMSTAIGEQWHKFSYDTSDKKSFSNVLFDQLNIPIVVGDNNITMHQLLRLMYVDQESPTNSLFLYEQFDSPLTRQTVSELLLGIYDETLYEDRIKQKQKSKELFSIKSEIDVFKNIHEDKRLLNINYINTLIGNAENNRNSIENKIIDLKENKKRINYGAKTKLNFEKINDESIIQRNKINLLNNRISDLNIEIDDSEYFLKSLYHKRKTLKNSILTREYLGSYPLDHCPECLSKLEKTDINSCRLCKQTTDDSFGVTQARRMEQEITFQIKESEKIMKKRRGELENLKNSYNSEKIKLSDLQSKVNFALRDVTSIRDEAVDNLLIQKGEIEGEISQYLTFLETAEKYESLNESKYNLERDLKFLAEAISYKEILQQNKKNEIKLNIEAFALNFLKKDLPREIDFKNAKSVDINYYDNAVYVDGDIRNFSASSNFYLKIVARFSIFFSSLKINDMRYPRFILCDNMEDKGIQKERSQHFQDLIVETANSFSSENYQMIFTTSMISDELKNSNYIVGTYYDVNNKTLKHV